MSVSQVVFERRYLADHNVPLDVLRERGLYVVPCDCDLEYCAGWRMAHVPDPVTHRVRAEYGTVPIVLEYVQWRQQLHEDPSDPARVTSELVLHEDVLVTGVAVWNAAWDAQNGVFNADTTRGVNWDLLIAEPRYWVALMLRVTGSVDGVKWALADLGFEYRRPSEDYFHSSRGVVVHSEWLTEDPRFTA
jgi:hypothetical protein